MTLRSSRLATSLDPVAAAFLDSTQEDAALLVHDIVGTAAHVHALQTADILAGDETQALLDALAEAYALAGDDAFPLDPVHEDVHMNLEAWLTTKLGDLGKKVHTGRSRNDQVALDLALATREHLAALGQATTQLVDALHTLAAKAPEAVLPGHTHLQPAQPITFGHWCGMHAARFLRDLARIHDAYTRITECPLGAAALAGSGFPIDPAATAHKLGFDTSFTNSLDAVSDRDALIETAAVQAQLAMHVSQLAEDAILYASPAFGFLGLDDAWATGSSIMPQKKNPDVFEVARAMAGTTQGTHASLLATGKGLASAYNRDLQETKRIALTAWPRVLQMVEAVAGATATLTPDIEAMEAAATVGFTDATEVADHLVGHGVPFRTAHAFAASLVHEALAHDTDLAGLDVTTVARALETTADDPVVTGLRARLGAHAAVAHRTIPGGTAPDAVAAQHAKQQAANAAHIGYWAVEQQRLETIAADLLPLSTDATQAANTQDADTAPADTGPTDNAPTDVPHVVTP